MHTLSRRIQAAAQFTAWTTSPDCTGAPTQGTLVMAAGMQDA